MGRGASAIKDALSVADIATEIEIAEVRRGITSELKTTETKIAEARDHVSKLRSHAMDAIQGQARYLALHIAELESAVSDIRDIIVKDKAHKNELLALANTFFGVPNLHEKF